MSVSLSLTFTFGDQEHLDNSVGALGRRYGYQSQITDPANVRAKIANPQSALDFVKARIFRDLAGAVVDQLANEQGATARATAQAEAQAAANQAGIA